MDNTKFISEEETTHRPVHPFLFTILILPMGITSGYVSVTLGYLLSKSGISVEKIAALISVVLLPHILKFIWAPLVDTTLSFKKWYCISGIITSMGIIATGILPLKESSLPGLTILVFLSNFAVTFLCMSTEGLMAYDVPDELKGRAGGFFQAGNLGGAGLGGGLGLILAQRLPDPWIAGLILGIICILCCIPLIFFKDPQKTIHEENVRKTYENLFLDVWNTLKTKSGILAMLLCFLTLGTGAAGSLWSAVAKDWKASVETIALVSGVMGGLLSAVGCIAGGWICDRMNSRNAYLLFGLIAAANAVCMAYSPKTEMMFIGWTSVYAFANGLCYAGFTAFVLEVIGKGAAATKYNIFAALSNSPIYLMTYIAGIAYTHFGAKGMLNIEAAFAVGAVVLFLIVQKLMYRHKMQQTVN